MLRKTSINDKLALSQYSCMYCWQTSIKLVISKTCRHRTGNVYEVLLFPYWWIEIGNFKKICFLTPLILLSFDLFLFWPTLYTAFTFLNKCLRGKTFFTPLTLTNTAFTFKRKFVLWNKATNHKSHLDTCVVSCR